MVTDSGYKFAPTPPPGSYLYRTDKSHYEPMILASNKDRISVKYLSAGPNAEHEQVLQLISKHCKGAHTETNRAELSGYTTVDTECTHGIEAYHDE